MACRRPNGRGRDGWRLPHTPLPSLGAEAFLSAQNVCYSPEEALTRLETSPASPTRWIRCRGRCPARRLWPRMVTGTGEATQLADHGEVLVPAVPHGAAGTPDDLGRPVNAGFSGRYEKARSTSLVILVLSLS